MKQRNSPDNAWICYHQPNPRARLRLFCFPYAGGSASIFRLFAEQLPVEIEVCPVQLPGRESRFMEKPFSHIEQLIIELHAALLPYLDMPYAFFGHSMGALVSFELARSLRRENHVTGPLHLIASAHRAPHIPNTSPLIYQLPETQFLEELRRVNGTPEEVLQNRELLQLLLPLLRADFELCETYTYKQEQPLNCSISAFGGLQDQEITYESMQAWNIHTSKSFIIRFFAGDHFFLNGNQTDLLTAISQDLHEYL